MPEDEVIHESIRDFLRGYARADAQRVMRLAEFDDWPRIARAELERRATDVVRALDDAALEAVAAGQIDLGALLAQAAQEQQHDSAPAGSQAQSHDGLPGVRRAARPGHQRRDQHPGRDRSLRR